jgi:type IV secretory pathway VirB4 component
VYLRNGAVRVVLSLSSPDFELLTDEEQMTFENCLMMLALSLNTPIMFHTTLKKMEIKEPAEDVEKVINSSDEYISENLKNYCSSLYVSYKKIAEEKGVYVRKSYCVVGAYLPDKKEDKILNELQSRVDIIAGGLSRASMKVNLMNSVQAVQLYADLFNKGKGLKVDELEKNGLLDLYSEGVGQVDII